MIILELFTDAKVTILKLILMLNHNILGRGRTTPRLECRECQVGDGVYSFKWGEANRIFIPRR